MFKSTGYLRYYEDPLKLIVSVDEEICRYYRCSVPPVTKLSKQKYPAHISVVRKIVPPNMSCWRKYQNCRVRFEYEHYVYNDDRYWWLNVFSKELEAIRIELGLRPYGGATMSPNGAHIFHITVGNTKEKR